MVKRALITFIAALALAGVAAIPARAQFGSLEGDVKDETGKPMVGAWVMIDRLDIKGNYKVKTDKKGHYFHGGLPLGNYNVRLTQDGRDLDKVSNVRVKLGDSTIINFDLKEARDRALAAQAGISLKQDQSGAAPQLSKEQRAQIESQMKQREATRQKQEKLSKGFNAGMEALRAARDNQVLIAQAGIQVAPGEPLTSEMRAKIEEQRNKAYDTAVTELRAAAEADPNQHVVFAQLGEAYAGVAKAKRGEEAQALYAKAFEAYQKAIALKPDAGSYRNNYALALVSAGKVEEAQAELSKAAELEPANAGQYYFNLGAVLTNTGRAKEATEAFRKATQANANNAEAWYQLGISLLSDAKLDEKTGKTTPAPGTIESLQKYVELQPNGAHAAEVKSMIDSLSSTVQTEIKASKKKR